MSEITVTVAGAARSVPVDSTAANLLGGDSGANGPDRSTVAARINGQLRDLAAALTDGDTIEAVPIDSPDGRSILRHSTAHVMAQAVQDLFPGTLLGIGSPIQSGFYYDFAPHQPFAPDDLARIEKRMFEIVKEDQIFRRRVVTDDDARVELADEPFKLELIGLKGGTADDESVEVGGSELTMYDNLGRDEAGDDVRIWTDLCRGPHLPTTRHIPAFTLMRSAAAYWRGS